MGISHQMNNKLKINITIILGGNEPYTVSRSLEGELRSRQYNHQQSAPTVNYKPK